MPFRLRPQPNQPVWKVNEEIELVDEAFDKFVGQIGGKGLDCDCRAHEAYSIEERPHVRGHRVKSSHAIRDSARYRVI